MDQQVVRAPLDTHQISLQVGGCPRDASSSQIVRDGALGLGAITARDARARG